MLSNIKHLTSISVILYVLLSLLLLVQLISIGRFDQQLHDLQRLLPGSNVSNLVIGFSFIFTFLGVLLQYVIGKFLLIIFNYRFKVPLFTVMLPKALVLLISVVLFSLFHNSWTIVSILISFGGSLLILAILQAITKNIVASFIFTLPFFTDILLSAFSI